MNDSRLQRPANAASPETDVETRLLYTAYGRKPLNLLMTLGVTIAIAALLWRLFPTPAMTLWVAAIVIGVALGYIECTAFKRARPGSQEIARWKRIFLAQSTVAGATWALGPCLMIQGAVGVELTLFLTILLAVCSVAMISMAEQRTAMMAFVSAVAVPPAFVLWRTGGEMEGMVALALVCGVVLTIFVGRRLHQTMRDLLESQGRTRSILDTALDAIIEIDAQGRITEWNRRAETVFGWTRDEMLGLALDETVIPQQHGEAFWGNPEGQMAGGREFLLNRRSERTAMRKDGTEFSVEMTITPVRIGDLWHFTAFIADITERKLAQALVKDSEERYRTLIDWSPEAIAVHSGGKLVFVNPAAVKLFGADCAQDLLGRPILDLIHPDFHQTILDRTNTIIKSGGAAPMIEVKYLKIDGTVIDMQVVAKSITYDGMPAVLGAMQDITERKQNEFKLATTNKRLSALIEAIPDAIFVKDPDSRWLITNEPAKQLFQLHGLDWQNRTEMELAQMHPAFRSAHELCLTDDNKAWEAGRLSLFLETIVNQDGRRQDFEVRKMPVFDEHGQRQALVIIGRDITESKQAEEALQENREKYRALSAAASEAIFISEKGRCLEQNNRAEEMFGYSAQEALGRMGTDWIAPADRERVLAKMLSGYEKPYEATGLRKDGTSFPALVQGRMMHYKGRAVRVTTMGDLSDRKKAEEAQRIAATAFESLQGMIITDAHGVILQVNKAFTEITGYSAGEAVGQNPSFQGSGRHDAAFYAAMWSSIEHSGSWQGEIWNRHKSGEVFPEWLNISAVRDDDHKVTHYVAAFTDISSRKSAEDQIHNLAFYDPLTKLPNRRLLMDRLAQTQVTSNRHQRSSALLFLDLDNFRTLNDTLGHFQGNLLLEQVAKRLIKCVREGDTVAHLGGDEFVVMLDDLNASEIEAATQAKSVSEKIVKALSLPYQLGTGEHHSTSSIGVALFGTDPQESADAPLKRAELAMFQAKAAGRNAVSFFDPQMQVKVTNQAAMETALREAVLTGQFVLYYQAQVVGEGRLTGVEALLRWQHPARGMVSPAEFIPMAEDTGLILPLGQWVLDAACKQLSRWADQPEMAQLSIAVNVSARQFHHIDFAESVKTALERAGCNPKRLKLELTESLLVKDVEGVIAKMSSLKAIGVSFSLDDFGTGYSSLSYLKRLPLDQLKIDQGFVRNILTDANDAAIAKMVIALAESLGLAVIAEGVEIEAQRSFLAHAGCHAYQGYLFSRPLPIDAFEAYARPATLRS
jgi:diguanylate cyclase (GGDEF)-like protein/PAS domain S-box-containing protein